MRRRSFLRGQPRHSFSQMRRAVCQRQLSFLLFHTTPYIERLIIPFSLDYSAAVVFQFKKIIFVLVFIQFLGNHQFYIVIVFQNIFILVFIQFRYNHFYFYFIQFANLDERKIFTGTTNPPYLANFFLTQMLTSATCLRQPTILLKFVRKSQWSVMLRAMHSAADPAECRRYFCLLQPFVGGV